MVQSINNPLWPMALVHAVSKVVKEKTLCAAEINAWILLLGFRIFFWRQLYIRAFNSPNAHSKCETTVPMLTLLIIVCMKTGCSKFIRRLKNTLWWLGCCNFLWDPLKMHHTLQILLSSLCPQYVPQHHHMACWACFSADCFTSSNW